MFRLSDDQLAAVMRAAVPLTPDARGAFLVALAARMQEMGEVGDGALYRVITEVQRKFWDPPLVHHTPYHRGAQEASSRQRDSRRQGDVARD
jgi:hypothetical protein